MKLQSIRPGFGEILNSAAGTGRAYFQRYPAIVSNQGENSQMQPMEIFMKSVFLGVAIILASFSANAAELVSKTSPHSVADTMDRLVTAVENAGATVFVRVDHAAGAAQIGSELKPNQMLVFGNPKIGTPVLQADPASGLDLPLRVAIFENAAGATTLVYRDPQAFAADYDVPADLKSLDMMAGALTKLTDFAVSMSE
tara:strand:- start:4437 stop:5030 length:594 start_codon:yes stop_codon:yes gene_type:complete